ncbi:cell wall protein DAN4-like [Athalia rosae]|uniref:cell wall protein DAN4-like n=1 Tax=Athalia rosae TaxID=37344 RepID=UPI002033618C|nr:cell wall protein DAN4-like [Athalia rosae]
MKAVRATCIVIALAFFVGVVEVVDADTDRSVDVPPEPAPKTSTAIVNDSTTAQPITTPTTQTSTASDPTTKPTIPSSTPSTIPTTASSSTTNPTTTTTSNTTTPVTSTSSAIPPASTTAIPPTPTPCPSDHRHFDGPSFMGGIILTAGLVAITFILWKFYKARAERNYRTL